MIVLNVECVQNCSVHITTVDLSYEFLYLFSSSSYLILLLRTRVMQHLVTKSIA